MDGVLKEAFKVFDRIATSLEHIEIYNYQKIMQTTFDVKDELTLRVEVLLKKMARNSNNKRTTTT